MNATEQMAVIQLAEARTLHAKQSAIRSLVGKGVRLEPGTRDRLRAGLHVAPIPTVSASIPGAQILDPGPMPVLAAEIAESVRFWVSCWLQVERFDADVRPGALLLHGPPGTGKTMATRWIASLLQDRYPAYVLDAHAWVSSHLGESGSRLAKAFAAIERSPSMLVLEEVDSVGTSRWSDGSAAGGEIGRVAIALMRLTEECRSPVVMTTNRLDALDPGLVRRFDATIEMDEPDVDLKAEIVRGICASMDPDASRPLVDLVREAKALRRREVMGEELRGG